MSKGLPECECGARNWLVVDRYQWRTITLRCNDCGKVIKSRSDQAIKLSLKQEMKEAQ